MFSSWSPALFFWLISILFSSVIWYLAPAVQPNNAITISYTVVIQELFRWGLYKLISRAEPGLNLLAVNPKSPYNRSSFAFVCGYGFGVMSGSINYVTLLVESYGPGVLMCPSCPRQSLFIISAITTSLFIFLHIAWMMLAFEGFSSPTRTTYWSHVAWVVISHLGASYATLLNTSQFVPFGCAYAFLVEFIILLVSAGLVLNRLIVLKKGG